MVVEKCQNKDCDNFAMSLHFKKNAGENSEMLLAGEFYAT
jgi:hypothetical protein